MQEENTKPKSECNEEDRATPFILLFLEEREGATAVTTCGTWDDIDAGDVS